MTRVAAQRSYGGKSAEERRAERRAAFIEAGRDLWCEQGWAAVTVRGVCSRAGVTDRYFYENFADRDALLVAVGEEVRMEVLTVIMAAASPYLDEPPQRQLRAAIEAVVHLVADNAGPSQIFFGDHGGSEALAALRQETITAVVDLFHQYVDPYLPPSVGEAEVRIALLVGIGGFVETVTAWRSGGLQVTSAELVEMLMGVSRRLGNGLVDLDS